MGTQAAQQTERKWDGVVRRSLTFSTRAIDEATRSFDVVASTATLDAHGDIVEQDWDLARYRKNPVVLWVHNNFESSGWSFGGACDPEDFLPVGKAENVLVQNGELVCRIHLLEATEEQEPLVAQIWRRVQQGVLRAVSVGFYVGKVTEETAPGGVIYRLSQCELLEISIVPIPSNPDAVAKSVAFEREQFRLRCSELGAEEIARLAGAKTANAEGATTMAMTPEEKAAFDAANTKAATLESRVTTLTAELETEKKTSARLETELKSAGERAAKAEASLVEGNVDKLVGKKLYPAERDEMVGLAKDIGWPRVEKILAARPDITLTDRVNAGGENLTDKSKTAPESVEGAAAGDASADIAKAATEAATKAA